MVVMLLPVISYADELFPLKSMRQLQMEGIERQTLDYSCGTAALAILLKDYFGERVEEEDVLADIIGRLSPGALLDRMREGFSMLDLKQSAQRMGYEAVGIQLSAETAALLKGPVIILLRRERLNHFVVLKGIRAGRAWLADPARGHLRIPLTELAAEWSGEALILGRHGIGVPVQHALALPGNDAVVPEQDAVRALRHIPLN